MLCDIYGDLGSGKTLLMVKFADKQYQLDKNVPVIADFKIDIPNFIQLELDELLSLQYPKALVELDEFDVYMNNRRAMSNLNIFLSNAIKQTRKRGLDVLASTQLFDTIDFRFTKLCKMSFLAWGLIYNSKLKEYVFRYDVSYNSVFGNRIVKLEIPEKELAKLYNKYDTLEVIMPQNIDEMILDVKNPKKLNQEVEKVTKMILDKKEEFGLIEGKRITEKKINDILLQLEKPEALGYYVVSRLEQKLNC